MNEKLYIIISKEEAISDENLFTAKAKNKESAIRKYAEDYFLKTDSFKYYLEERSMRGIYSNYFFKGIYDFDTSRGSIIDMADDKTVLKIKKNIKYHLGELQQYTEMLFDFYQDDSKTMDDLDYNLLVFIALGIIYEDIEHYLIKEVVI